LAGRDAATASAARAAVVAVARGEAPSCATTAWSTAAPRPGGGALVSLSLPLALFALLCLLLRSLRLALLAILLLLLR
jgi:hypothetical protein